MRYATSLGDVVVVRPLLLGSLRLRPHCACFRPRDCAQSEAIRAVQARRLAPLKRYNLLPCVSVNNCATRYALWNNAL